MEPSPTSVRVDVFLDVACLFRTRTEAQQACKGGKVDVNGQAAKPNRTVKAGDVIDITRPLGRRQKVIVRLALEKHIPKAQARTIYEDVTPPPSPEEQALLDLLKLAGPRHRTRDFDTSDRRERRRLRREKEGG